MDNNSTSFTGDCGENNKFNTLIIETNNNWTLVLNYTLLSNAYYQLSTANLTYIIDKELFPNAQENTIGRSMNAAVFNLTEFSASKDVSYKCFSQTTIKLNDDVSMDISITSRFIIYFFL